MNQPPLTALMYMNPARTPALTDADRSVLGPLAENRFLTVPQLAALLEVGETTAARRLRRLRGAGLVSFGALGEGGPSVAAATRAGLRWIGSPLREARLDRVSYRHEAGVGWLWLAAHRGAFGDVTQIATDRQMRAADAPARDAADTSGRHAGPQAVRDLPHGIGLGLLGPHGHPQRHYPDLLLETAGGRHVAIELELNAKSAGRMERIMTAYASDSRIDAVIYLVPTDAIAKVITGAARRTGFSDLVHVQRLAPEAAAAPGRARTRERPQRARAATSAHRELGASR